MNSTKPLLCLGLACLLVAVAAEFATAGTVRIAVVRGNGARSPNDGAMDRLEVQLSHDARFELLERREIARITREQEMTAAGLSCKATAVRLGKVLSVDCFLVVERFSYDAGLKAEYRLQFIEGRTGIVVGSHFISATVVDKTPEDVVPGIEPLLANLVVPDGQKRYVGFLGYHGEVAGASPLSSLPDALSALVANEVGRAPGVIVVNREHLQELQGEKELVGADMDLALSAFLVEGSVRTGRGANGSLRIHTVVHAIGKRGDLPVIETECSAEEVTECYRWIAAAIVRQIGVRYAGEAVKLSAKEEATWFARRAASMLRYGEFDRARPFVESAYVLDPLPQTALMLAQVLRGQWTSWVAPANIQHAQSLSHEAVRDLRGPVTSPQSEKWSEGEKRYALQRLIRAVRLWNRYMDARLARWRNKSYDLLVPRDQAVHQLGGLWRTLWSEDPETMTLYRELRALKEKARATELEHSIEISDRSRHGSHCLTGVGGYYDNYVFGEIRDIMEMSQNAGEYVEQMKALMTPWPSMPGYTDPCGAWHLLHGVTTCALRTNLPERFRTPEGARRFLDWCRWMREQPSRHFKLAGWYAESLICPHFGVTCNEAPERALEVYLDGLPKDGPNPWTSGVMQIIMGNDQRLFDGVLTHLDRRGFVSWYNEDARKWNWSVSQLGRDYQLAWLDAAIKRLPSPHLAGYRPGLVQASIEGARETLTAERHKLLHRGKPPQPEISRFWSGYRVEPANLACTPARVVSLDFLKREDDRLILLWTCSGTNGATKELRSVVADLNGRTQWSSPGIASSANVGGAPSAADATLHDGSLYVAARRDGLLIFTHDRVERWSVEQGLPKAELISVAVADGRLFLGYDRDYLYAMNLGERTLKELAYSRSLTRRNALDGCQQRFRVCRLQADPTRQGVQMTTEASQGEWWISSSDGGINRVVAKNTDERLRKRETLYGDTRCSQEPRVTMARDVISAGLAPRATGMINDGQGTFVFAGKGGLYLHKDCVRDAFHLPLESEGKPMHADYMLRTTEDEALVATRSGGFWRITDLHQRLPEEEEFEREAAEWQAFVRSQTNSVAAPTVTASSHAPLVGKRLFVSEQVADGDPTTCWATATNDVIGAWIAFDFKCSVRLSSLRIVNGWVPDGKRLTLYPVNHRVKRLAIGTDQGERVVVDIEDHNDPQYHRVAFEHAVRHLRLTVEDIYESEYSASDDPPWLNISEVTFFGAAQKHEAP